MTLTSSTSLFISTLLFFFSMPSLAQSCKASVPDSTPDSRYTNHNDGTITDNNTRLMWKQCIEGLSGINSCKTGTTSTHTWQAALKLADAASFATYTDWRLPSVTELESLVTHSCYVPSINIMLFPNDPAAVVWSSAQNEDYPPFAWGVYFFYGYIDFYYRDNDYSVRLVRSE